MILIQTPWRPDTIFKDLGVFTENALAKTPLQLNPIVLLPHSDLSPSDAMQERDVCSQLSEFSKSLQIYLSCSVCIKNENDYSQTVGFLFDPDGEILLRTPKIMPDLLEGFSDSISENFNQADFSVAMTEEGQVGILCGEDILSPHITRALITNGAEVILNPSREWSGKNFEIRQKARQARAYENLAYVASASPLYVNLGGVKAFLPPASSLCEMWGTSLNSVANESFIIGDIDIESLRRRRKEPMGNLPAIVRMRLYSPGYMNEKDDRKQSPSSRKEWIVEANNRLSSLVSEPLEKKNKIDRYDVLLGQTITHQATKPDELLDCRKINLDNALNLARPFSMSPGVKLVAFPEFFLTGAVSQLGANSGHIAEKIGISFPGPEADKIAKFAQDCNAYVAGGVFEYDPSWPNRFFNSAFIFDDTGNLIHLYRKIHCADVFGRLPDTTPGSVFTEYIDRYGYEHLFPVAETKIGKLCTVICFDMNFGETHRAMVKRGAEIIIHPTAEPHNIRRRGWDLARHVRAFENTAYLLTAGHGGEFRGKNGPVYPGSMSRGYSKVINFDGTLQCVADSPGAVPLVGSLDLKSLRRSRNEITSNLSLWDNPSVYADSYSKNRGLPNDIWAEDPMKNPYENSCEINKVLEIYKQERIYIEPEDSKGQPVIDQSMQPVV